MARRTLHTAAALAAAISLLTAGVAVADTLEGDEVAAVQQNGGLALGTVCADEDTVGTVYLAVRRQGGGAAVFANGSTVTISPDAATAGLTAGVPSGAITIPGNWNGADNGTRSPVVTASITLNTSVVGAFAGTVTYEASGINAQNGNSLIRKDDIPVTATVEECVTNTPPVLDLPDDIEIEGNTLGGAIVDYVATATDTEDGDLGPVCAPASGGVFPVGDNDVECSVTDSGGLSDVGTFTVTVIDTTAPDLSGVPDDQTLTYSAADGGAFTTWVGPTADDIVDGDVLVSCERADGLDNTEVFPLGTTVVTCTATDAAGNTASDTFTVSVVDKTAPVLSGVPDDQTASYSAADGGAAVIWTAPTADDDVDGSVPVTCESTGGLGSGDVFPLGTTVVTCTATDAAGNAASDTFNVVVSYSSTGILQPINANGTSVFKAGSTIPVKVALTGASAGFGDAVLTISLVRLGSADVPDVNEAVVSTSAHTGTTLRYDAAGDQYIFNLSTKGLSAAVYQVTVTLDDGTTRTAQFGLRK